jgi:hypothetical protein
VFGLAEVKQVGWLEHGGRLGETAAAEKRNGAGLPFAAAGVFLRLARSRSSIIVKPRRHCMIQVR